ncbi:MASE1 domain-containing protein [Dyella jejuensis]
MVYGFGIFLCRQVIFPHYLLFSGVRVATLALTPYRYWPALILGEEIWLVPLTVECWSQFGVLWGLLNLIPATTYVGSFVWLARQHQLLEARKKQVHVGVLLTCALAVSLASTAYNLLLYSVEALPDGYLSIHPYHQMASQWLLGNFIGILTVAPLALALYQASAEYGWKNLLHRAAESRFVFEGIFLVLPVFALLIWLGLTVSHARGAAQICLFLPVVWLALRHGWQGAAWGGTLASLANLALMPEKFASNYVSSFDHHTVQAEVIIAFAISTMLLVGARIGVLNGRAEQERKDVCVALDLARNNLHLGELQLRATSQALEQIRETVRSGYAMMLGRLRHLQPAIDDGGYQRVALVAQDQIYRLADGLHPVTWRERGLPAALREGAVARALDEAGIRYVCDLRGPISLLSMTLHMVIYRVICEAIAEGCQRRDISDIVLHVRSGEVGERRGVAIRVSFGRQPARLAQVKWDELMLRLARSTSSLGIKALQARVATFEGLVSERELPEGRRISCLMLEP